MPAPRSLARFNKHFTNRLTSKVAGYLPGFAIVSHVGRKSGRTYRTPVNAFRTDGGYIIALTYGAQSDWVKNVLAAGSCELQTRGQRVRLSDPYIVTDESKGWAPLPVRLILNRIDAPQYMRLSVAHRSPVTVTGRLEEPRHGEDKSLRRVGGLIADSGHRGLHDRGGLVNRSVSRKRSPLRFVVLVFALSLPIWLIEPRDWPITASVDIPLIAALILVYREDGRAGARRLLRRVFDQRRIEPKIWYVPTIFLLPIIYLLTYEVTRLMGLPLPDNPYIPLLKTPLLFVLFFILAVGEEGGGLAMPSIPCKNGGAH